jgi:two-component system, response regulator
MTDNAIEIVLVEDNPDHAALTIRALKKNNLTNNIQVLRDGAEALDFFFGNGTDGRNTPKVILLDLKLPKVDGIEVLRRLRQYPHTKMIPIVVLTTSREDRDLKECYALGVNSYIVKPVDFQRFSDAVKSLGMYWLLLNQAPAAPE